MYRVEYDTDTRKARCNFNDENAVSKYQTVFNQLLKHLHQHICNMLHSFCEFSAVIQLAATFNLGCIALSGQKSFARSLANYFFV